MVATFRQPFDLLAEAAMSAASAAADETVKSAKTEIWLGNLDSNQDKQSQSLLCYRYTIPHKLLILQC